MSSKKEGMLTVSDEWAKHLRPWGRRLFWSGERMETRKSIRAEAQDEFQSPGNESSIAEAAEKTVNHSL